MSKRVPIYTIAVAMAIALAAVGPGSAQDSTPLQVTLGSTTIEYWVVESSRVSRTEFDYSFRATLVDSTQDLPPTIATVSIDSATTAVYDGQVSFPPSTTGVPVTSSDTFTLRQNRQVPFEPSELSWSLSTDAGGEEPGPYVLPTPNPDPCAAVTEPCSSAALGMYVFVSTGDAEAVHTTVERDGVPIAQLDWVLTSGTTVDLQVSVPGTEPALFAQYDQELPDLDAANLAASSFAALNSSTTATSATASGTNTAGCDVLHDFVPAIDCRDYGGCCDEHDFCIHVNCAGDDDSGNVLECAGQQAELFNCLRVCNAGPLADPVCAAQCIETIPQCSALCTVCHVGVVGCFATTFVAESLGLPLSRPSDCCQNGNCRQPQKCLFGDGIVRTADCACEIPPTCGPGGGLFGDPHMLTLDQTAYDFQAVGEFILVRSVDDSLEVQVRTKPWRNLRVASVTTAAAMRVADDRVGFYVDRVPGLVINGEPMDLPSGQELALPTGGSVSRQDQQYVVNWPDGAQVRFEDRGRYLNLRSLLCSARRTRVEGLLGNFDGVASGDLVSRGGATVPAQPSFDELYKDFGDSWRISQEESLFDYLAGNTTETHTDLSFPGASVSVSSLSFSTRTAAEAVCRTAGVSGGTALEWCIFDVGLTGDPDFAALPSVVIDPVEMVSLADPDPTVTDSDGDGITDDEERGGGTIPFIRDSDEDGFDDALELLFGSDPTDPTDSPPLASAIVFGQSASGTIAPPTERDLYSFTGRAGDVVEVPWFATAASGFRLLIEIFAPTGTLTGTSVIEVNTDGGNGSGNLRTTLTGDGTHILRVRESNGEALVDGQYDFTLQRTVDPGNVIRDLPFGASVSGAISPVTQIDVYRFSGQAGDQIEVPWFATATSGFRLLVELYGTAGTNLADSTIQVSTSGGRGSGILETTLPADGDYFLWVREGNNFATTDGTYDLTLQRRVGPGNVRSALDFGDSASGSISPVTQIDVFEFTGRAGDSIQVPWFATASSGFRLLVELYDSAGTNLADSAIEVNTDGGRGSGSLSAVLPADGQYFLWVRESNHLATVDGTYDITLQRTVDPGNLLGTLLPGVSRSGSISPVTEVDVYQIEVNPGDLIEVPWSATATNGFRLRLDLFDGDGNIVATSVTGTGAGVLSASINAPGPHYLWVRESNHFAFSTGSYTVRLDRIPRPTYVIDFDDLPGMDFLGSVVPEESRLSDSFLDDFGVLFESEGGAGYVAVANLEIGAPRQSAPSVPNAIGGVSATDTLAFGRPIKVSFLSRDGSLPAVTNSVSVRGDLRGSNNGLVRLEAYDVDDNFLGGASGFDADFGGSGTLSVAIEGIHYVLLRSDDGSVGYDDLAFPNPVVLDAGDLGVSVPEPGFAEMLLVGYLAQALFSRTSLRRREQSRSA